MKQLICFFGIKRSGNHPVINWIFSNVDKKIKSKHYNNVNNLHPTILSKISFDIERNYQNSFYLLSYEDFDLRQYQKFQVFLDEEIKNIKNGLLLRDPFNFFASRLKRLENLKKDSLYRNINKLSWEEIVFLWKMYAKEFLGESNFLFNKVCINYNDWFKSKLYRDNLSIKLGLDKNQDLSLNEVLNFGMGSSFDLISFDGEGSKMKVLERWKYYKNNSFFKSLFKDKELLDLSNQIFGHIKGTEVLFNQN